MLAGQEMQKLNDMCRENRCFWDTKDSNHCKEKKQGKEKDTK